MTDGSGAANLPLIRRTPAGLEAETDALRLRLSRKGGMLEWPGKTGRPVRSAELHAMLTTPDGPVFLRQSHDTDPRLVICEQGPVRLVLRVLFSLLDAGGARWGEGLAEWTAYSDGDLAGVLAIRLINADGNARLNYAALRLDGIEGRVRGIQVSKDSFVPVDLNGAASFDNGSAGLLFDSTGRNWAMAWRDGKATAYDGGRGPWQGFGDDAPYYEDWGTLPDQGWGDSGWAAGPGAGVSHDPKRKSVELVMLRSESDEVIPPVVTLQGQLLCVSGAEESIMSKIGAWRLPRPPAVSGAHYRGYSVNDLAHMVYAPDCGKLDVTVPPSGVPVAIHVYGLSHWGGWTAKCNGEPLLPQLVNDGRGCDDPNGLQLGRFDDRHGPIIGRTDVPANRLILRVPPGKEEQKVQIEAGEGLGLSYLHWDDRQIYLVQSSANHRRNMAELTVRDGKLRQLVAPHSNETAVAAVPLYWYQCNSPTPYMAVDELTRWVLMRSGPDAVEFEVRSRNRYGCADGVYRVKIPFDPILTCVEVHAELSVKKAWHFKDLQLLNLFAEEFRDRQSWPHDFALAMDRSGKSMIKRPKEGRKVMEGDFFSQYEPPLLLAHYSASRGNVFLAQNRMDGPVTSEHVLCPHWIDSHYHVVSLSGKLEPGDQVRGEYTLLIDDGRSLTRLDVESIARAVTTGQNLQQAVMGLQK